MSFAPPMSIVAARRPSLSRRAVVAGLAAMPFLGLGRAAAAPGVEGVGLEVLGAPNGATLALADVVESGRLGTDARFRTWRMSDDLRAAVVAGRTKLFSSPTHIPANLANRGLPIHMLCVLGLGHLGIVGTDPGVRRLADLAGRSLIGFFRKDMPDLIFRAAAVMEGLDPDRDLRPTYVQTATEAATLVASGRAEAAILPEPLATVAIRSAAKEGRTLHHVIDLNAVWAAHRDGLRLPMAGVAIHADLIETAPQVLAALHDALPAAVATIATDPAAAAERAGRLLGIRPEIFTAAFPDLHIDLRGARAAQADFQAFYETLLALDPEALAGRLPADDFYLDL